MKANELRIGNYVLIDGDLTEVESINKTGIQLSCDINPDGKPIIIENDLDETITPIPLTEEWLVRFGFGKRGIWFKNETPHSIAFDNDKFWFMGLVLPIGGIEIKYVHQLQNLYFALTVEELILI